MNKYSVFVFALVIAVTSAGTGKPLSDKEKEAIKRVHTACQNDASTKLEDGVLTKLRAGEHVEDPKVKVHMLCMAKGTKFMTESGELNTDYIKTKWAEHYDGEDLTKLHACLVKKDTPEETASALASCQHKIVGAHAHEHHH